VATFDDVTGLRRAEESARRLATVVTDSNDAIILFDLAGRIQVRVAEREVANVFGPALDLQARAFLEHAPDPGSALQLFDNGSGYAHAVMPLL
jgi:PAS domain-containing protein